MSISKHLRTALAIGAFSVLAVSPALAQGNGKGKAKGKSQDRQESAQVDRQRPTLQLRPSSAGGARSGSGAAIRPRNDDRYEDRDDDRYDRRDDDRRDDRLEAILRRNDDKRREVPPGWCKGRGNPHNTPENCGYADSRRDDRYGNDRYGGRYDGYRSYAEAHTAFHRALDREYAARAAQRRSDPIYQLRLRSEKASEHQRWHERMGTRH